MRQFARGSTDAGSREAGTVGGAGAWVRDDAGRVLLVRHESENAWSDPGGKQEPGEQLEATARRDASHRLNS